MTGARRFLVLGAAVAGISLIGCDGLTSPRDRSGVYVMERIGPYTMPSPWFRSFRGGDSSRTIADTVHLSADGTGIKVSIFETLDTATSERALVREEWPFTYRVLGPQLELTDAMRRRDAYGNNGFSMNFGDAGALYSGDAIYSYRGRGPEH